MEADVSKDDDVKRLVETTVSTFGRLRRVTFHAPLGGGSTRAHLSPTPNTGGVDVLINNAGVSWFGSMFEDNAVDLFDRVMAINVR